MFGNNKDVNYNLGNQVQMLAKYGNSGFLLKCRTHQYLSNLEVFMLNFFIIWTIWRWCYIPQEEEGWGWIGVYLLQWKDHWEWKTRSKVATHLF